MTWDGRIEKLVAVGASVAASCASCLRLHARDAEARGASAEEIAAAIAVGRKVRKGAESRLDEVVAALGTPEGTPSRAGPCCG